MKVYWFIGLLFALFFELSAEDDPFLFNGVFGLSDDYKFNLTYVPENHTKWVYLGDDFYGLKLLNYRADSHQLLVSWDEQEFFISLKKADKDAWSQRENTANISWKTPSFDLLPLNAQLEYLENYPEDKITEIDEVINFLKKRNSVLGRIDRLKRHQSNSNIQNAMDPLAQQTDPSGNQLPVQRGSNSLYLQSNEEILNSLNEAQLFDPHTAQDWPEFSKHPAIQELKSPKHDTTSDE